MLFKTVVRSSIMNVFYRSIDQERSLYSLQPTIIVGLGGIGWLIRYEWERRYKTYKEFYSPLITDVTDVCFWMLPSDVSELPDWEKLSFEEHRQRFLTRETLTDHAQQIASHYHKVRAHIKLSLTDHVRPTVFVIGATWSPEGRALLWPLAYLIRFLFGDPYDYELVGVFVTAQWEDGKRKALERDALTYELLEEGNRLAQSPDWQQTFARVFACDLIPEKISFDKVFLIDNVKQNNATSPATYNSAEIVQLISDMIEACLHSDLLSIIDRSYTADCPTHHPLYIGIGISSLVVPLVRLYDNLTNTIVANLVRVRLLTEAEQLRWDDLKKEIEQKIQQELNVAVLNAVRRRYQSDVAENQNRLELTKEYEIGQTKQKGKIVVIIVNNVDRLQSLSRIRIPQVFVRWYGRFPSRRLLQSLGLIRIPQVSLYIRGPDLLSPDESLQTIDERIDSENSQIDSFLRQFRETIRDYKDCLRSIEKICDEAIQAQLRTGEQGLVRAIRLTESIIEQVKNAVIETKKELSRRENKLNSLRKGGRSVRRVSPLERLKIVTPFFSRPQALLLRVLLIGIVCYQFYYDGLLQGIYRPPLDLLRAMLGEGSEAAIRSTAVGLIILCLGGLAIITLLPWFLVRLYLFRARQYVCGEQQTQLVEALLQMRLNVLTRLQGRLENYLNAELKRLHAELKQQHARFEEEPPEETYQEYSVVDLKELIQSFHYDVEAAIQRHRRPLVTSWLHDHADLNNVWPTLITKEEVFDNVRRQIGDVVKDRHIRPISTYLATQNLEEWAMRISKSSVPWVKIVQPIFTLADDAQNPPIEMMCLLASEGRRNLIALQIVQNLGMCELLSWADPYRIMLVRIIGGFKPAQLTRWSEMHNRWMFVSRAATQTIAGEFAHLAVSQPTDGVTGDEKMNDSFDKVRHDIQNLLDAARSNVADRLIELDLERVEEQIRPLLQIQSLTPNPEEVVKALKELCHVYDHPALADEVRHCLSDIFRLIDGWLARNHIRPLVPERGERYDPRIHGTAIGEESDQSLPSGTIKCRVRRGYIQDSNNKLLLEPLVIVVKEP